MKVLVTNPPWIFRDKIFKRSGVRAGSRWPFSSIKPTLSYKLYTYFRNFFKNPSRILNRKVLLKLFHISGRLSNCPYIPYPVFMGYATSYLQSKGIEAKFYDAIALRHNYSTFYKTIDRFEPDIIIQETSTPSFNIDLEIANKLHKKYEICLVGSMATTFAEKLIEMPFVDYILKGAYEYSVLEMCQTRRKGLYDYNIAHLDDLPYPYRDEIIIHHYRDFNCLKELAFPQLWVYASRGCIFHCDFCLWVNVMLNKKLSLRSPKNIIGEVDDMTRKYGFKHVYFDDDCWNIGPEERLMKIADGMHKIGLPWTINARLDLSSKEMFRYFVDRGCAGLRLGVESLSQPLLDIIHKDLKIEDIIDKIKFLEKLDVESYLLFMHYLPFETQEDRNEQNRIIKELGHRYQNPPCIPFPGTPYYEKLCNNRFMKAKIDWSEYDGGNIGGNLFKLIKDYSDNLLLKK